MSKEFIERDSLEGLGRVDVTIIDSDNDVWSFAYGAWHSQMNNAWPDAPRLPVWEILDA